MIDRDIFFNRVRDTLFGGSMTLQQVTGMNLKLDAWERNYPEDDRRWLAYCFATSYHETGQKMWPVEERGKGRGHPYGVPDPVTGLVYYGRGEVQLTWAKNYKKATAELKLTGADDLYWHPERALDPTIAANCLYKGMIDGWYRADSIGRHNLVRYFDTHINDPYNAREIVNGDKTVNGNAIKGYHGEFLTAINMAWKEPPAETSLQPILDAIEALSNQLTRMEMKMDADTRALLDKVGPMKDAVDAMKVAFEEILTRIANTNTPADLAALKAGAADLQASIDTLVEEAKKGTPADPSPPPA